MSRWETPKSLRALVNWGSASVNASSLLGVVNSSLLQSLGKDGDGRVDGVRDDEDQSFGACSGDGLCKGSADASVDL